MKHGLFNPNGASRQTKLVITIIKLVVILVWLEIVLLVCGR